MNVPILSLWSTFRVSDVKFGIKKLFPMISLLFLLTLGNTNLNAQTNDSVDFLRIRLNNEEYLFSKKNSAVAYTIASDKGSDRQYAVYTSHQNDLRKYIQSFIESSEQSRDEECMYADEIIEMCYDYIDRYADVYKHLENRNYGLDEAIDTKRLEEYEKDFEITLDWDKYQQWNTYGLYLTSTSKMYYETICAFLLYLPESSAISPKEGQSYDIRNNVIGRCKNLINKIILFHTDYADKIAKHCATLYNNVVLKLNDLPYSYADLIKESQYCMEFPESIESEGVSYPVEKLHNVLNSNMEEPLISDKPLTIRIPSNIKTIEPGMQINNRYIVSITFNTTDISTVVCESQEPPQLEYSVFAKIYDTAVLVVPDGSLDKYLEKDYVGPGGFNSERELNVFSRKWWYKFKSIKEASDFSKVKEIDEDLITFNSGKLNSNGQQISIYDVSGREIYRGKATDYIFPSKGIFIVRNANISKKIIVN